MSFSQLLTTEVFKSYQIFHTFKSFSAQLLITEADLNLPQTLTQKQFPIHETQTCKLKFTWNSSDKNSEAFHRGMVTFLML